MVESMIELFNTESHHYFPHSTSVRIFISLADTITARVCRASSVIALAGLHTSLE